MANKNLKYTQNSITFVKGKAEFSIDGHCQAFRNQECRHPLRITQCEKRIK